MTDATAAATGSFHVSNGQFIDPTGATFVARGINVLEGNQPSADTLQSDFPNLNFVRLAIYDYANPADLSSYVDSLTSKGIVVELEDHANSNGTNAGGNQGNIFSGQQLTNELDWYGSAGAAFKDNPYVWFGTNNEPSEVDSSGNTNPAALSSWQHQTYDAIRGAGNTNPVLVEANSWGVDNTNIGYNASDYAGMTNVAWDAHYYGWLSGYSTDQGTVSSALSGVAAAAQQITSADGTMPVIIGEYGNSTDGQSVDANGAQVITAVQDSGYGSAAWAYLNSNGDGLITSGGGVSSYGQEVASFTAAGATVSPPSATPTATTTATQTATTAGTATVTSEANPNGTILAGSGASLTDSHGSVWTISNGGSVEVNGQAAGYSSNVTEIAMVNGSIWQENADNLWWSWDGSSWGTGNGTSTSPIA